MNALTLHQPFASLIADKRKTCETRCWAPPVQHVGKHLAIHAGIIVDDDAALEFYPLKKPGDLPRGALVAVARLKCAFQVKAHRPHSVHRGDTTGFYGTDVKVAVPGRVVGPWPREADYPIIDPFGDWERGRWIWMLEGIKAVLEPVRMRGHQGIWTVPENDLPKIQERLSLL